MYNHIQQLNWRHFALVCVNLPVTWRYADFWGSAAYLIVMLCVSVGNRRISKPTSTRLAHAALFASLIIQICLLVWVTPHYDARMDRDDAIVLWWGSLANGQNPYATPTTLGNPISILPFAEMIGLPFVLIKNVGLLPIAAYLLLIYLIAQQHKNHVRLRNWLWWTLATAPVLLFEVAGRSDLVANMALFILIVHFNLPFQRSDKWQTQCLFGIALGCLAATRVALWPIVALIGLHALFQINWRARNIIVSAAFATFLLLLLPFVLWDSTTFFSYAPFGVNSKKLGQHAVLQWMWPLITLILTAVGVQYSLRSKPIWSAALPIIAVIVVATWTSFFFDVSYVQLLFVPLLFSFKDAEQPKLQAAKSHGVELEPFHFTTRPLYNDEG